MQDINVEYFLDSGVDWEWNILNLYLSHQESDLLRSPFGWRALER